MSDERELEEVMRRKPVRAATPEEEAAAFQNGWHKAAADLSAAQERIRVLEAALVQVDNAAKHGWEHYKGAVAQKIVREVTLIARAALKEPT